MCLIVQKIQGFNVLRNSLVRTLMDQKLFLKVLFLLCRTTSRVSWSVSFGCILLCFCFACSSQMSQETLCDVGFSIKTVAEKPQNHVFTAAF